MTAGALTMTKTRQPLQEVLVDIREDVDWKVLLEELSNGNLWNYVIRIACRQEESALASHAKWAVPSLIQQIKGDKRPLKVVSSAFVRATMHSALEQIKSLDDVDVILMMLGANDLTYVVIKDHQSNENVLYERFQRDFDGFLSEFCRKSQKLQGKKIDLIVMAIPDVAQISSNVPSQFERIKIIKTLYGKSFETSVKTNISFAEMQRKLCPAAFSQEGRDALKRLQSACNAYLNEKIEAHKMSGGSCGNVTFIWSTSFLQMEEKYFAIDGFHLNLAGQKRAAEMVKTELLQKFK